MGTNKASGSINKWLLLSRNQPQLNCWQTKTTEAYQTMRLLATSPLKPCNICSMNFALINIAKQTIYQNIPLIDHNFTLSGNISTKVLFIDVHNFCWNTAMVQHGNIINYKIAQINEFYKSNLPIYSLCFNFKNNCNSNLHLNKSLLLVLSKTIIKFLMIQ